MTWPSNKAIRADDKRVLRGEARRLARRLAADVLRHCIMPKGLDKVAARLSSEVERADFFREWRRVIRQLNK